MSPVEIHNSVSAVCPIEGLNFGSVLDKMKWEILFKPEATDAQKAAAMTTVNDPITILSYV